LPVDERQYFIDAYMTHECSMSELCGRFGISRKTGYTWTAPFLAGCELADLPSVRTIARIFQRNGLAIPRRAAGACRGPARCERGARGVRDAPAATDPAHRGAVRARADRSLAGRRQRAS